MNPEEKAKELVYKMYNVDYEEGVLEPKMRYSHAVKCALIAVGEILNTRNIFIIQEKNYWQEVKQEIELL